MYEKVWEQVFNWIFHDDATIIFKYDVAHVVELDELYLSTKNYFYIHWVCFEKSKQNFTIQSVSEVDDPFNGWLQVHTPDINSDDS